MKTTDEQTTIAHFLIVLTSKLTRYDARLTAKDGNIYRLGHLLGAAHKVESDIGDTSTIATRETLAALVASLGKRFILPFPPADAVMKQIDAYLTSGKRPSLDRLNPYPAK